MVIKYFTESDITITSKDVSNRLNVLGCVEEASWVFGI